MVDVKIGTQTIPCLVDTGAQYSVMPARIAVPTKSAITIVGATGVPEKRYLMSAREVNIADRTITHQFLYVPECPVPLLGRDLLSKLQAQIHFQPDGLVSLQLGSREPPATICLVTPLAEEWRLHQSSAEEVNPLWERMGVPGVWAEDNPPARARYAIPVIVELKPGSQPVSIRQYPIPRVALQTIHQHLSRLYQFGILKRTQSPWNTPLLPVKKPGTQDYRPVQDLRGVNQATVTIHPVVPNPYVLLGIIPQTVAYFSVLDLKDAFFSIPLAPQSQNLFAFTWEDPSTGTRSQYTWTRLVQGFKNSPTIFGEALTRDLLPFRATTSATLLQYVDDLLLGTETREECLQATRSLLLHLCERGYRVSKKKAQLCQTSVRYLGFIISQGQRQLRKRANHLRRGRY
uniref:ribonuclease H n=1 Tax=Pelusios castaneus TaxID=367368 RepID=A0A8C8RJP0_9SAUR